MSYISKYTGAEIEEILDTVSNGVDGGVPIVNSVDELDPNSSLGSMASVVEPGSISETLISELPQPDSSIINMDTGFIDTTSCPQVSGLSIIIPEGPIPVSMELTENLMLYFCSESLDMANMTTGIALGITPQIVNNEIIALAGMYMNVTTMEQKQWAFFTIQDGVVTADQAAIDECNAYIKDLHYIGVMNYVMGGQSLTTEQLIIYDNVVKVVSGVPSKAHVYLKKDNWEELYAEDLEKLEELESTINEKADKITISEYNDNIGVLPNVYTTYTISSIYNIFISLVDFNNTSTYKEYIMEIRCETTPQSVQFNNPDADGIQRIDIKWPNGVAPTFEAGNTYLVSIVNEYGLYTQFLN